MQQRTNCGGRRDRCAAWWLVRAAALGVSFLVTFAGCSSDAPASGAVTRGWIKTKARGDEQTAAKPASLVDLTPRYHALVIGINQYRQSGVNGWDKLTTARGDAEAIGDVLASTYGFEVTRLLDGQATRSAIMAALDGLVTLNEHDAALVYFAGHGYYDDTIDEGYWIPSDARRIEGSRLPNEDWLWNSTIKKMLGASRARHVFVIADSCFSGSLFRGGLIQTPTANDLNWYRRAVAKPSRYLLTSGDIEPVIDSGLKHSIFAQQVLNYLSYPERSVFAASDLGAAVREKVSTLTGQMVRSGPLAVASHAGGEFVFIHREAKSGVAEPEGTPTSLGTSAAEAPVRVEAVRTMDPQVAQAEYLKEAVLLGQQGAVRAARSLVAEAAREPDADRLVRAVQSYFDAERQSRDRDELRQLIDALEARKQAKGAADAANRADQARPRIVACLGPTNRGVGAENEATALLTSIGLHAELANQGAMVLVERESLNRILQELNLGFADLADPRAQLAIGRLLPASLLLLGDVIPAGGGSRIQLRLVDTETTRVLGLFAATPAGAADLAAACADLARQVAAKAAAAKPLTARVSGREGDLLQAGVGRFHGATAGMRFALLERTPRGDHATNYTEKLVGSAQLVTLGEESSDLRAEWQAGVDPAALKPVWVVEREAP